MTREAEDGAPASESSGRQTICLGLPARPHPVGGGPRPLVSRMRGALGRRRATKIATAQVVGTLRYSACRS